MSREIVKIEDLTEWTGSTEDFIKEIRHNSPVYIKKDKGRTIIHWWWETRDMWFMNHANQTNSVLDESGGWNIATQMPNIFDKYKRDGYKFYLKS